MASKSLFTDSYNDPKSKEIKQQIENFYRDSISQNMNFWANADLDSRFESGDQNVWREMYPSRNLPQKQQFSFNHIKRIINMITGYQRKNRKSTIVTPVENGDQQTSDQFTKIIMHINRQESVLETISEAFQSALISGLSLMQIWVDYRKDPVSGDVKVDMCPYSSFIIDFFKKPDLSDCNAVWKRNFLTPKQCVSLLPEFKQEILSMKNIGTNKDGKFQYIPENFNVNYDKLYTYDEYYYRDFRTQLTLIDSQTGETLEWAGQDDENLDKYLATYPTVSLSSVDIPTIRVAILVQGRVLYDDINPLGDNYPFIPVFGYFTPQLTDMANRFQGVVRGLRDPQYLYNTMKGLQLEFVQSRVNPGFIYKPESLVNPTDIYMRDLGKGIGLKAGAQMTDVQQIVPPDSPASWAQLAEAYSAEIMQISSVNEELLGAATDDKAGVLSMLRQGAGLTTLQILFDQLDRSQKILGQREIAVIQSTYTPGKIKRIIEAEPSPQFYNKAFGKYDAVVEDGINTSTQRQMQFAQLMNLKELGVPIPDDVIIKASTLQDKQQLIDAMGQTQAQQAEMAKQQQEIQMQLLQAQTELANARAIADKSLGAERISRIPENRAMAIANIAEANKDDEAATLDKIKAIKELESIDFANLEKLVNLITMLKGAEQTSKEGLEQEANVGQGQVSEQGNM